MAGDDGEMTLRQTNGGFASVTGRNAIFIRCTKAVKQANAVTYYVLERMFFFLYRNEVHMNAFERNTQTHTYIHASLVRTLVLETI